MAEKIVVIGGGAAGFFAAITASRAKPQAEVLLLERSARLLQKVAVSGGGRCNVMHHCFDLSQLLSYYPRGQKELRQAFSRFGPNETLQWFENEGVKLKTEPDGRMFPITNSSQTIIDALINAAYRAGVMIKTHSDVDVIEPLDSGTFKLHFRKSAFILADKVIVATGGSPKLEGLQWIADLGIEIVSPVPSLFTFNMPGNKVTELMGVSVPKARIRIEGSKLVEEGPLLITHWGMSGPVILRMSAWGARYLAEKGYQFTLRVNWLLDLSPDEVKLKIQDVRNLQATKQAGTSPLFDLPKRLWHFLLDKSGVSPDQQWAQLSKKQANLLLESLTNDSYSVKGKTTFKEEFVTCGGVSMKEVHPQTMESGKVPGLYFTGEILDVDGITGGFNFQAAWSTGYAAGKAAAESLAGS